VADYAAHVIGAAFADLTGIGGSVDVGVPIPGIRLGRLPDALATSRGGTDALRGRGPAKLDVSR
jgi:isopenicillin-N epimerase